MGLGGKTCCQGNRIQRKVGPGDLGACAANSDGRENAPAREARGGRSPSTRLRGGRAGGVGDGAISSSGVGVPWPVPHARLKVRHPRGKEWAWRPGRRIGASCRCKPLAQEPQGRRQAENLRVAASLKGVQTSGPAQGRRTRTHPPACARAEIGAPLTFNCTVSTDLHLPFAPLGSLRTVL